MKTLLCTLLIFSSINVLAQGTSRVVQDSNQWLASFGFWNWTERMTLTQGLSSERDWANLQANSFGFGLRGSKEHWGYDLEAFFLSGKAGGGGLNSLSYQQGNLNFSGYGGKVGLFYRTEKFIEFGVEVPALFRNLSWPKGNTGIEIKSGSNPMITAMIFWRFRPTRGFYIEQGFGPAGAPSQSVWNMQATALF